MKVNIGLALVGVIIGEFLAARRGLGYLIIYGSQVFQLNMVITSIIILCIIAMGLYQMIQWLEHYYKKNDKRKAVQLWCAVWPFLYFSPDCIFRTDFPSLQTYN